MDPDFKLASRKGLNKSIKPAKSYRNSQTGKGVSSDDDDDEEQKPTEPTVFQMKLSLKKSWEDV